MLLQVHDKVIWVFLTENDVKFWGKKKPQPTNKATKKVPPKIPKPNPHSQSGCAVRTVQEVQEAWLTSKCVVILIDTHPSASYLWAPFPLSHIAPSTSARTIGSRTWTLAPPVDYGRGASFIKLLISMRRLGYVYHLCPYQTWQKSDEEPNMSKRRVTGMIPFAVW